jgi:flagellar motor switch protein FliG
MAERKWSPYEKAAMVIQAIGPERSGPVLRQLPEPVLQKLLRAVAVTGQEAPTVEQALPVLEEFVARLGESGHLVPGGLEYARKMLEAAFGRDLANDWLQRLQASAQARPFAAMYQARPEDLATFLQLEHPQTVALVLTYLPAGQAAGVLTHLPDEMRVEVARRIGRIDMVPPRVLRSVESSMTHRMASWAPDDYRGPKGLDVIVDIMNKVDRATERSTLNALAESDPDLATLIKERMFLFDDITQLNERTMQTVLRRVDKKDLALALRPLSAEAQARIFANMARQAVEEVQADMNETGPVPLRDVEAAQSRIVAMVRQMEEAEEIDLSRGGADDVLV